MSREQWGCAICAGDEELKEMKEREKVHVRHRLCLAVEPEPGGVNVGNCGEC